MAHLDLVGLVVHEKPVVYLTTNLPQMGEVRDARTRPLDEFEQDALNELQKGEDLHFRGSDDRGRMMGAMRAVRQCIVCHEGSRGDLLGAISYTLVQERPQP